MSFWSTFSSGIDVLVNDLAEMNAQIQNDVARVYHGEDDKESESEIDFHKPAPPPLLRHQVSTFTTDPPDVTSFQAWVVTFRSQGGVHSSHRSVMDELLADELSYEHYTTLVPHNCSIEDFWSRYIYKLERLEKSSIGNEVGIEPGTYCGMAEETDEAVEEEESIVVVESATEVELKQEEVTLDQPPHSPTTVVVKADVSTEKEDEAEEPAPEQQVVGGLNNIATDETKQPQQVNVTEEPPRAPSPNVVVTKMDLPIPKETGAVAEDWELWE